MQFTERFFHTQPHPHIDSDYFKIIVTDRIRVPMATPCFYTNQQLLPQSQSPRQLSAWLSGKHAGYDLVAWCFYGNLIKKHGCLEPTVEAVAYMTQFIQSPDMPPLGAIGIRPFQSSFSYDGAKTNGYLMSGDVSLFPNPAVTVTSNPWSVVVSYSQFSQQSTNCISLLEGEMGMPGAKYMLTADVLCAPVADEDKTHMQRLRAEITIVDAMGVVSVGYGPSSFAPSQLTPQQALTIKMKYNHSVAEYLEKTNDPMTDQGSYYYSAPLLEVKSFKIVDENDEVLSEGNQGTLWMDYVVQSYKNASKKASPKKKKSKPSKYPSWHWFAIQFPDKGEALVVSCVKWQEDDEYPFAMFYNTTNSPKMENGALRPVQEWKMSEIAIIPDRDPKYTWHSPRSKCTYNTKFSVKLGPSDTPAVNLTIECVRNDQEVYVSQNKFTYVGYEGVVTVSGTINGKSYDGLGWVEMR